MFKRISIFLLLVILSGCFLAESKLSSIISLVDAVDLLGYYPECSYVTEGSYRLYPRDVVIECIKSIEPFPLIDDDLYGRDCDDSSFYYRYNLRRMMPGALAVMITINGNHQFLRVYSDDLDYIDIGGTVKDNDTVTFYYM